MIRFINVIIYNLINISSNSINISINISIIVNIINIINVSVIIGISNSTN